MFDMRKILGIIVVFSVFMNAYEPLERPNLNQGTKALEKKYPWLYEKMDDILMDKENAEAYASDSAYFKRLDDLNNDGIDEVYLHSSRRCGASICNYRVYEIDVKNKKLREIFDAYNDFETTQIGSKLSTGWKSIFLKQCWGASDCYENIFMYDSQKKYYVDANVVVCDDDKMCNATYSTCIMDYSIVLEERLNRSYKLFLENQDDKVYEKKIEKSQSIWKEYRESQLEMAFPHSDNPKYFWTGFNACYYSYKNDLTLKRIEEMNGWEKWLDDRGCKSYDTTE